MLSLINTACRVRKCPGMRILLACSIFLPAAYAQEARLIVPSSVIAGNSTSIATSGSGSATFYLVGPATAVKREVELGQSIVLKPSDVRTAGRYEGIVCTSSCSSAQFYVAPSKAVSLTFLVHPSRVATGQADAISGVAIPFDEFHNMVLAATSVEFQLTSKGVSPVTPHAQSLGGILWFRGSSSKAAGAVEISASLQGTTTKRIVQQVAAEPCNLRIKGQRNAKGVLVETDPIHDCLGNPVPDGTVVTFTAKSGDEVSTVDAPVKQDIARAQLAATKATVISAASGVVMGNELRVGAQE